MSGQRVCTKAKCMKVWARWSRIRLLNLFRPCVWFWREFSWATLPFAIICSPFKFWWMQEFCLFRSFVVGWEDAHIYWDRRSHPGFFYSDETASYYSRCRAHIYFVHELHIWPLGGWLFTDGNGRSGLSVIIQVVTFSFLNFEMQSNKDNRKDDLLNELASDYANYLVVDSNDEVRELSPES